MQAPARRAYAAGEPPRDVLVPETIEELGPSLDALRGDINAGGWATAAAVYAWTEPGTNQFDEVPDDFSSGTFTLTGFAKLGIRGLSTRDSVRRYRRAWKRAVDRGWALPTTPGQTAALPEQDFRETEAHVGVNSGDAEWFTPAEVIAAARAVMGSIDLDPASSAVANEVVQATRFYTSEQDGLRQAWAGRVWINPPFNQPTVKDFCARLMDEVAEARVQAACALLNNNTETALFQAMAQVASAICFPLGRMKFWHPEKEPSSPLQGQAVLYFGQDVEAFRAAFVRFGFTVAL